MLPTRVLPGTDQCHVMLVMSVYALLLFPFGPKGRLVMVLSHPSAQLYPTLERSAK